LFCTIHGLQLRLDLNADVGESFGPYSIGDDASLIPLVTSANVAAGFHGGDPSVLRTTIRLAKQHGVAVGAHPGFPDLAGFGRRPMHLSPTALEDAVLYQVVAVAGVAASEGLRLQHVKAHGALYNMAAADRAMADAFCRAVAAVSNTLVVIGPPQSALVDAAMAAGLPAAAEGFADRAYQPDGALAPRGVAGAVIDDPAAVAARVLRMVREQRVTATDGADLPLAVETVCIHGDTPGAASIARRLRDTLQAAGVRVAPLGS
jgi:UPF0271 protein